MRSQAEWLSTITDLVATQLTQQTAWIVFSGAPSSGKTTTAELLRDVHRFHVRDEIARREITQLKVRMNDEELIQTLCSFEFCQMVIEKKLEEEPRRPDEQLIIDSGLPEGYSYFQLLNPELTQGKELDPALTEKVAEHLNRYRYKLIFSFEMLPLKKDGVRVEDEPHRQVLHQAFRDAYTQLGYHVIVVPVGSREERVAFVLNEIRRAAAVPMEGFGLKNSAGTQQFGFYAQPKTHPLPTQPQASKMHASGLKNRSGGVRFWNELVGVPVLSHEPTSAQHSSSSACDLAGQNRFK